MNHTERAARAGLRNSHAARIRASMGLVEEFETPRTFAGPPHPRPWRSPLPRSA